MAGTDHSQEGASGGPVIILVEPQLGENIGTAARAMLNCGLTELRLVSPRDGWPNFQAEAAASGAVAVLEGARLFDSVPDAISDLNYVMATTARDRSMIRDCLTPRGAATELRRRRAEGQKVGVMFGPERAGLITDHVALADATLTVPLNPAFSSLNLAQAVLLIGYEWFTAQDDTPDARLLMGKTQPAEKAELDNLMRHLEEELETHGFFGSEDLRPTTLRNLRNQFHRMEMTAQEVRTFHGVIAALAGPRRVPKSTGD